MVEERKKIVEKAQEVNSKVLENKQIAVPFEKRLFTIFRDGIIAFSLVLIILSVFKLLAFSTGSVSGFVISLNDIIYSFWASAVVFSLEIISYRKS